jgi:hypothetical protein
MLRSWRAHANPVAADGYEAVPVSEPERMPQRVVLTALWCSVDGTVFLSIPVSAPSLSALNREMALLQTHDSIEV